MQVPVVMLAPSSPSRMPMSFKRRFMQLDVFSCQPMKGNPLAVVIDGDGMDEAAMRAFARWTNLSETAFLLPPTTPQADYRVRIFTPNLELPFAGHPSVGSAYTAIEAGLVDSGKTQLIQQCAAGLLPVTIEQTGAERIIHVQAPTTRLQGVSSEVRHAIAEAIGMTLSDTQISQADNGPLWWVCDLREASCVRTLKPDMQAIARLRERHGVLGVSVFGREPSGPAQMAVRAFCPGDGLAEDPVTGSVNAAIMAFLAERGDAAGYGLDYVASQGREVGCDGYVRVRRHATDGTITIGGQCVPVIRGELAALN
jgi:PhzF family phenazine biosynthesis protein